MSSHIRHALRRIAHRAVDWSQSGSTGYEKGTVPMAGKRRRSWKKIALWVIGVLVIIFAVIQAIPYGRTGHTNPP